MSDILKLFREGVPFFETLRESGRQEILNELIQNGPMMVNDIAEKSLLSRPAVSHHLKILKQVDLVKFEKDGVKRIYTANMDLIIDYLSELLIALKDKKD